MDMSLSIERGKITSIIYEKKLTLYLYIPPHAAHPPGILAGLIMGNTLRIHQLCTNEDNIVIKLESSLTGYWTAAISTKHCCLSSSKLSRTPRPVHSKVKRISWQSMKPIKKQQRGLRICMSHSTPTTHHQAPSRISGERMW